MLVWLWVPLIHLQLAFQLNLAASGALLSASRAPSSASTLTPFWTCLSVSVLIVPSSGKCIKGSGKRGASLPCPGNRTVSVALDYGFGLGRRLHDLTHQRLSST